MSPQDIIYLAVLLASIPFGHVIKSCGTHYRVKQLLLACSGFVISWALTGAGDFIHPLVVIAINYVIIAVSSARICHVVSFVWTFAYLLFFRLCHQYGFKQPTGQSNAVQLLVTLRMVSLAFEKHETTTNDDDSKKTKEVFRYVPELQLDFMDFLAYSYSYIGLMTGPFYTYRTFQDMVHHDARPIATFGSALRNLKLLPAMIPLFLVLVKYFPLTYLESEEYVESSVLYQLLILVPTFTWFRWRFYIGWLLAESMCMTAGLGLYPKQCKSRPALGPTTPVADDVGDVNTGEAGDYDFETIHNINIMNVELAPTMRAAMKDWNMTVQWWMATFVYKKLPVKSAQIRMFLLLFVSAFWHGVHPGYYLTFMSVPLVVIAETRMSRAVKPYLNERFSYWWDWVTWFCLYRSFEYLGVGFMLLKLGAIWRVWTRMYFVGHVFIVLFILLPVVIPRKNENRKDDSCANVSKETRQQFKKLN